MQNICQLPHISAGATTYAYFQIDEIWNGTFCKDELRLDVTEMLKVEKDAVVNFLKR